ncbi:zinc finger protein 84-like [Lutzomyia longipalpis]|uniref:zinc finger protein 84-like n=1 Tax=Lutzomyia longipalpis TaxID=7200 RepID=UPI0024841DDB|nr:zinc finger protein 84-like [Lutzomyia longipalpis]
MEGDRQKQAKGVQERKNHHDWSSSSDTSQEDNVEAEKRRSFRCERCSRSFTRFFELMKHKKRHHGVEISGSPVKTTTETSGHNHQDEGSPKLRTHSEDFQCSICSKTFKKKNYLRMHEKRHGKIFKCAICKKAFSTKHHVARHLMIHSKRRDYECHQCGRIFKSKNCLQRHEKIHSSEKPNICKICGKGFKNKYYLPLHSKVHETNRENFECAHCGKICLWKKSLRRHLITHFAKGKKYSIHGKIFKNKTDMQSYLREYSLTRIFQCDRCPKAYKHKGNLQSHQLTFHGKKPFRCGICGKKVISKQNLNKHIQAHDKNRKTYDCAVCYRKFFTPKSLSKHLLHKHLRERA